MSYIQKFIKIFKSPAMYSVWNWTKPVHKSILLICLLNSITTGGSLVITLATRGLIDNATYHNGAMTKAYAALLIGVVVMNRALMIFRGFLNTKTNAVLGRDIRYMFMSKLLRKNYRDLSSYHSGELVNRMFSDVGIIQDGAMSMIPQVFSLVISFVGATAILLSMDWRFIVLLVAGGIISAALTLVFKKPMKLRHRKVQEARGEVQSIIQETVENMKVIKASCSEERMETKVLERQDAYVDTQLWRGYFSVKMNNTLGGLFQLSWLFCMLWGCRGIYRGVLTYGSLAAIIQLVGQVQGSISGAADLVGRAYGMTTSAERLQEIMDLPEEEREKIDAKEYYDRLEKIAIRDMSFSYGREDIYTNVNLDIHPGETLAVTGESGCGKSTLFQLLLGIYQPTTGTVGFAFSDGKEPACAKTRQLFAYVPQGNNLFSGTLRENLAMFTDHATDEEIIRMAQIACIDHLITRLPQGLNTILGERGVGLSEGQAQRIAVARALLSDAPILLLDESTSALDEATEARLLENIGKLKNKTCLIVTHRKAALNICSGQITVNAGHIQRI